MENTFYDYSPIVSRPKLKLPNNARIAFWVAVHVESFDIGLSCGSAGAAFDVRTYSQRDYGPRVGIWRIMETLDKHGIRATAPVNSDVCERYPLIVEEAKKRGWEFMGHGASNSRLLSGLSEEEERSVIHNSLQTLTRVTGQRPWGWRSPGLGETFHTADILADEGIEYLSDWSNDDQPYPLKVKTGRLIALPNSPVTGDKGVFDNGHHTPEQFLEIIKDQFDTLYREGIDQPRVMSLSLHPFVIGLPFRIGALDKALEYVKSHSDVWFATGWDIVSWYRDNCMGSPR